MTASQPYSDSRPADDGALSLQDLWSVVSKHKIRIAILAFLGVVIGLIFYVNSTPLYRVKMTVTATEDTTSEAGAGSGVLGRLTGMQSSSQRNFERFKVMLTTAAVAQELADKHAAFTIFFPQLWDEKQKKWNPPSGLRASISGFIKGMIGAKKWTPPTSDDLRQEISKRLTIIEINDNTVDLAFEFDDPEIAAKLLLAMHHAADTILRNEVKQTATARIKYLENTLPDVSDVNNRLTLINLMSTQQVMLMLSQATPPFSATILDNPVIPSSPAKPRLMLAILGGLILGVAVGIIWAFLLSPFGRRVGNHD
ncbi:hypothetical protein [Niveispirillum irakense]|uniref:hypothetical protein n=1 Tax=Niveispirillum irakense TaxID=34011 RepID=UPI000A020C30|nr:hypothetical protein [Niveispirillum irakense]